MSLSVVGLGLASPAGARSSENVFFLRAGEPGPRASPFVDAEGEAVPIAYCPTIGARETVEARLVRLAELALDECLGELDRKVLAAASVFLTASPHDATGARVAKRTGAREVHAAPGAAGIFEAIAQASAMAAAGQGGLALFVAVDSWIDLARLGERLRRPPNPWINQLTLPGEGAAALLLATPEIAKTLGLPVLATLHGALAVSGPAHDDNDLALDGAALTSVVRALPSSEKIGSVFGQHEVDRLRQRDWAIASARNASRLEDQHESVCLESELGLVGDAAGAMSLVYGIAALRHRATRAPAAIGRPMLAWAIDRGGLRGGALATVEDA